MELECFDLFAPTGLRLHDGGAVEVEIPPRMSGNADGWVVATFHVESNADVHADHWEIHPAGNEVVGVLSGAARLFLRREGDQADSGNEEMVTLAAGNGVVVPQNRWHRLEVDGPTDLQSITPRAGSRLERRA